MYVCNRMSIMLLVPLTHMMAPFCIVKLDRLYQALEICTFNEKGVFVFKQVQLNACRAP